jgi:hypothetical protein
MSGMAHHCVNGACIPILAEKRRAEIQPHHPALVSDDTDHVVTEVSAVIGHSPAV